MVVVELAEGAGQVQGGEIHLGFRLLVEIPDLVFKLPAVDIDPAMFFGQHLEELTTLGMTFGKPVEQTILHRMVPFSWLLSQVVEELVQKTVVGYFLTDGDMQLPVEDAEQCLVAVVVGV